MLIESAAPARAVPAPEPERAAAQAGQFDVIFLRNVMIYFSLETKRQVVARLLAHLRPGGYF
jgi:chemotaxis methyl-accepting protein methylase